MTARRQAEETFDPDSLTHWCSYLTDNAAFNLWAVPLHNCMDLLSNKLSETEAAVRTFSPDSNCVTCNIHKHCHSQGPASFVCHKKAATFT